MKNIEYEVIINTCDKYSDLWDAHILLMNQSWADRDAKVYLLTDKETERKFAGVEVVCAGEYTEITERLKTVLDRVKTKYVLFTLDDYFLTEEIDNSALQNALEVMEQEHLDFLRLFAVKDLALRKERAQKLSQEGFYLRGEDKENYKVSLYPGFWRTDFMRKTLDKRLNAWQYEVALTKMANELGARCAVSNNHEFPFLDVIRKGKVLRNAQCYFQQNPIYSSDRQVMSAWDEWKLNLRDWLKLVLPKPMFSMLKRLMIKCGMEFYSPVK